MVSYFNFSFQFSNKLVLLDFSGIRFGILNRMGEPCDSPPMLVADLNDVIIVGCGSVPGPVYDYHLFTDRKGQPGAEFPQLIFAISYQVVAGCVIVFDDFTDGDAKAAEQGCHRNGNQ